MAPPIPKTEASEFDNFFRIPQTYFNWVGLNPYFEAFDPLRAPKVFGKDVRYAFVMVVMLWGLPSLLLYSIKRLGDGDRAGFLELTMMGPCIVYITLTIQEMYIVSNNAEKITEIIRLLRKMFPKSVAEQRKFDVAKIDRSTVLMRFFAISYSCLIGSFALRPILIIAFEYRKTGVVLRELPYKLVYPFDQTQLHVYPFCYTYEIYCSLMVAFVIVAVNTLLGAIMLQIGLQFSILATELRALSPRDADVDRRMGGLIDKHVQIIRICEEVEELFSGPLFVTYIISSIVICLAGFNIVADSDFLTKVTFVLFMVCCLLQIVNISVCGQNLIDNVSRAIIVAAAAMSWVVRPSMG